MDHIYEVKHRVLYDIENKLKLLENFLIKAGIRPKAGLYIRGNRFPLTHEEHGLFLHFDVNGVTNTVPMDLNLDIPTDINCNIIDRNDNLLVSGYTLFNCQDAVSKIPFHPVLITGFISQVVDYLQYGNTDDDLKHLYFRDIFNEKDDYLIDPFVRGGKLMIEDIVAHNFPNLPSEDLMWISDFTNNEIVPIFYDFMHERNMLYSVDLSKASVALNKHNDIRAVRYMKLYQDTKFSIYMDKEYEENV